jgi:hypothetical protein
MTRRRGLPFPVNRERYWAVMLPIFAGSTRLRAAASSLRRRFIKTFAFVEQQTVDDLVARAERIEGQLARLSRGR